MSTSLGSRLLTKVAVAVSTFALVVGSAALADEQVSVSSSAPEKTSGLNNALEVSIAGGYSQGVGDVGRNVPSLTDSGGPGVSLELDVGWRIDPHWLVGVYGSGAWLSTVSSSGNANNNWTATAGVQGNYHFLPGESFDPWIGLGAGWRGYWVNRPEGRDSRHGLDIARLQVGVDVPVANGIAISPFIGASATMFLTQQLARESSFSDIDGKNVNVFLNAGVLGRFDLFGTPSVSKKDI